MGMARRYHGRQPPSKAPSGVRGKPGRTGPGRGTRRTVQKPRGGNEFGVLWGKQEAHVAGMDEEQGGGRTGQGCWDLSSQ